MLHERRAKEQEQRLLKTGGGLLFTPWGESDTRFALPSR
jgi:hypothetical protein